MKTKIAALLMLIPFIFAACSSARDDNAVRSAPSDAATDSGYLLDTSASCEDVNYLIDSHWKIVDTNASGNEYKIPESITLHLWYEEPLRGESPEDTLFRGTNIEKDDIFTNESFEFNSEKARRTEEYSKTTVGDTDYEFYDSVISFIRNDKVFHITILGYKTDQELCHKIIEDVFSSISF